MALPLRRKLLLGIENALLEALITMLLRGSVASASRSMLYFPNWVVG
jgi:hypothetical protein